MLLLKKKILFLLLPILISTQILSEETDGYEKLLELNTCNLKNSSVSITKERNVNKFIKRINSKSNLNNLRSDLDFYILNERLLSCFEKVNLTNIYTIILFKLDLLELSENLLKKTKLYRGFDREFANKLADFSKLLKEKKILRKKNDYSYSEAIQAIPEENKEYSALKKEIEILKSELDKMAIENTSIQGYQIKNQELEDDNQFLNSSLIESNKNLERKIYTEGISSEFDLRANNLRKIKEELKALKKENRDTLFLLNDSYRLIEDISSDNKNLTLDNNALKGELKIKDELIGEFINQSSKPKTKQIDKNINYWWFLLVAALMVIFYYYYYLINNEDEWIAPKTSSLTEDLTYIKNSLENQGKSIEEISSSFDSYIYNYLKSLVGNYFEDKLEAEIAFDDLLQYLVGESVSEKKRMYFLDDSELALRGKEDGKKDSKKLKKRAGAANLKKYLES